MTTTEAAAVAFGISRRFDSELSSGAPSTGARCSAAARPVLAYFRQRYFANGQFTRHFAHLHLRPADQPEVVRSVLDGSNDDPRDRLLTVLMVVWRFRNNLFHGEKWAYQLQDQLPNFTHANAVLMRLLERHGRLAGWRPQVLGSFRPSERLVRVNHASLAPRVFECGRFEPPLRVISSHQNRAEAHGPLVTNRGGWRCPPRQGADQSPNVRV